MNEFPSPNCKQMLIEKRIPTTFRKLFKRIICFIIGHNILINYNKYQAVCQRCSDSRYSAGLPAITLRNLPAIRWHISHWWFRLNAERLWKKSKK